MFSDQDVYHVNWSILFLPKSRLLKATSRSEEKCQRPPPRVTFNLHITHIITHKLLCLQNEVKHCCKLNTRYQYKWHYCARYPEEKNAPPRRQTWVMRTSNFNPVQWLDYTHLWTTQNECRSLPPTAEAAGRHPNNRVRATERALARWR